MKKIYILSICFLTLLCNEVFSQIEKGSLLIGGQFDVNRPINEPTLDFNLVTNPELGVFLSKKFLIGAQLGFDIADAENFTGGSISIVPFTRWYFRNDEKPLKWFSELRVGARFGYGDIQSGTTWGGALGVGANLFLNSQVALEGILQYQNRNFENFDGSGDLVLGLGVRLFLNTNSDDEADGLSILKSGKFFIGGSTASINLTQLSSTREQYGFSINPNIGYFLNEHFAIGSEFNVAYANADLYRGSRVGINPFIRVYPFQTDSRIQTFLNVSAGGSRISNKFDENLPISPNIPDGYWSTEFKAGIGLDWFLSENAAIEGTLQYNYSETPKLDLFSRFVNFNVSFQYFIGPK